MIARAAAQEEISRTLAERPQQEYAQAGARDRPLEAEAICSEQRSTAVAPEDALVTELRGRVEQYRRLAQQKVGRLRAAARLRTCTAAPPSRHPRLAQTLAPNGSLSLGLGAYGTTVTSAPEALHS